VTTTHIETRFVEFLDAFRRRDVDPAGRVADYVPSRPTAPPLGRRGQAGGGGGVAPISIYSMTSPRAFPTLRSRPSSSCAPVTSYRRAEGGGTQAAPCRVINQEKHLDLDERGRFDVRD